MLPVDARQARIFRLTHCANIPWILKNGLHCVSAGVIDPAFVPIGLSHLIQRRSSHALPHPFHGTLADYVPFYFTPCSPMLLNILGGQAGLTRYDRDDLVILVSSLGHVGAMGLDYVFTDRHALSVGARFSRDSRDLNQIDWLILRNRDFKRSDDDPDKLSRYQAEALIKSHVPVAALLGMICHSASSREILAGLTHQAGVDLGVAIRPKLFFA